MARPATAPRKGTRQPSTLPEAPPGDSDGRDDGIVATAPPANPAAGGGAALSDSLPLVTVVETPLGDEYHSEGDQAPAAEVSGPVAAAVLAAGTGAAALGAIVTAEGISAGLSKALIFVQPVGPLSGKTTVALGVWLAAWLVLHWRWRDREVSFRWVTPATCALVALGVLLTFPPGFDGVRDLLGP